MQKNIANLKIAIDNIFFQLQQCLQELNNNDFTKPIICLGNVTIGNHIRHIIELYIELEKGYENGIVNYDKRQRNYRIETDISFALEQLENISNGINRNDKSLLLVSSFNEDEMIETPTNYARELVYNLEHTVHHMALIRVGLFEISDIKLPTEFGVAASTIKHKQLCVQ